MRWILHRVILQSYCRLIGLIAYGPWGFRIHQWLILFFCRWQKIDSSRAREFYTLGDFFLRETKLNISQHQLISPAESFLLEAQPITQHKTVSVKGFTYHWKNFSEVSPLKGCFWNFYLAPHNYHWVHAPCDGNNLRSYYHRGALWPVNDWARRFAPEFYSENERMTFVYENDVYGRVVVICIGALGVSSFKAPYGHPQAGRWLENATEVKKGEPLLGFKLGSSVLLILENPPPPESFRIQSGVVNVGDAL